MGEGVPGACTGAGLSPSTLLHSLHYHWRRSLIAMAKRAVLGHPLAPCLLWATWAPPGLPGEACVKGVLDF